MDEQQVNDQMPSQNETKSGSPTDVLDGISAVFAVGGAVASFVVQNAAVAAVPLALSVGVHLYNRRQSMDALKQHFDQLILQQNLHVVHTEQRLQKLTEQFTDFQQESAVNLSETKQETQNKLDELWAKIRQMQQEKAELQDFTETLESHHQQLATTVGELCQIENYSQALNADPSAAEIYYQRGQSHQRIGDKESAIADYTQAIRANGHFAKAYHSRGVLYAELGQRKLAVLDLRQASKLYFEQGDLDSYQQARDLNKEYYDLRDIMPNEAADLALENEQMESMEAENVEKIEPNTLSKLVSVNDIFAENGEGKASGNSGLRFT